LITSSNWLAPICGISRPSTSSSSALMATAPVPVNEFGERLGEATGAWRGKLHGQNAPAQHRLQLLAVIPCSDLVGNGRREHPWQQPMLDPQFELGTALPDNHDDLHWTVVAK
jgi:hypothetical protein